jgi:hypothetical protein
MRFPDLNAPSKTIFALNSAYWRRKSATSPGVHQAHALNDNMSKIKDRLEA